MAPANKSATTDKANAAAGAANASTIKASTANVNLKRRLPLSLKLEL